MSDDRSFLQRWCDIDTRNMLRRELHARHFERLKNEAAEIDEIFDERDRYILANLPKTDKKKPAPTLEEAARQKKRAMIGILFRGTCFAGIVYIWIRYIFPH